MTAPPHLDVEVLHAEGRALLPPGGRPVLSPAAVAAAAAAAAATAFGPEDLLYAAQLAVAREDLLDLRLLVALRQALGLQPKLLASQGRQRAAAVAVTECQRRTGRGAASHPRETVL
jgi:hypothetical protein